MRQNIIGLLLLITATIGCGRSDTRTTRLSQMQPAPAIEAQVWLNGEPPSTAGKVVVVDVWASW